MKINFWYQFFIYHLLKRKRFFHVVIFYAVKLWVKFSFNLESNVVYIIWLHRFGSRFLKRKVTRGPVLYLCIYSLTKCFLESVGVGGGAWRRFLRQLFWKCHDWVYCYGYLQYIKSQFFSEQIVSWEFTKYST